MNKKITLTIAIVLIISAVLVIYMNAKNPAKPEGHFIINQLEYAGAIPDIDSQGGYHEMTVEEIKLVDENDIEYYDWKNQEIKLTNIASKRINPEKLAGDPLKSGEGDFSIRFNGTQIYAGSFLLISPQDSMKRNYPKIKDLDGPVIHLFKKGFFVIRPKHPPGLDVKYSEFPKEGKEIIENKEVKEFFKKLGKLKS